MENARELNRYILFSSQATVSGSCHVNIRELLVRRYFIIRTYLSSLATVNVESVTQPVGKRYESSYNTYE